MRLVEALGRWLDPVELLAPDVGAHHVALLQDAEDAVVILTLLVVAYQGAHVASGTASVKFFLILLSNLDIESSTWNAIFH